jgi:hypothetical protein
LKGFSLTRLQLSKVASVDLYDLHAEAGSTQLDQDLSADQYEQLAAFVNSVSVGRAIVLAGDTNLHTDATHPDGHGTSDRDIWDAFQTATGITDVCNVTTCDDRPHSIDKIAFRNNANVQLTPSGRHLPDAEFTRADGEHLSDHSPVAVTFDWRWRK